MKYIAIIAIHPFLFYKLAPKIPRCFCQKTIDSDIVWRNYLCILKKSVDSLYIADIKDEGLFFFIVFLTMLSST